MQNRKIIEIYGSRHQTIKLLEELGEASASVSRYINNPNDANLHGVKEELCDCLILIEQFFLITNTKKSEIALITELKLDRTLQRIKNGMA